MHSILESYTQFPRDLIPKSGRIDLLLFLLDLKPVFRTNIIDASRHAEIESWGTNNRSFYYFSDRMYIGKSHEIVVKTYHSDMEELPHEYELGMLFGYPKCCCRFIESVGEKKIDAMDEDVKTWAFSGTFKAIDPTGYFDGLSLV